MLSFTMPDGRFHCRAAAVIRGPRGVLLHRAEHDDFWSLPGGRMTRGEPAVAAVEREVREELGVEGRAGRLIWLAEAFYPGPVTPMHEVAFYFEVALPPESGRYDVAEFTGMEGEDLTLIFRWFSPEELAALDNLHPSFLRDGLRDMPRETTYLVALRPLDP